MVTTNGLLGASSVNTSLHSRPPPRSWAPPNLQVLGGPRESVHVGLSKEIKFLLISTVAADCSKLMCGH